MSGGSGAPGATGMTLAEIAAIITQERVGAIAVTGPGAFAGQLYEI